MYCNCFARQIYEFLRKLVHGCKRACCGQREPRRSASPDGCGGFRQARGLAVASAHHLTITRMKPAPARCEPIPAFSLLPGPSTCPAWLSVAPVAARCEPIPAFPLLPGPATCPAGLLRHPPLPGVSLFRCFRCYLHELSLAYALPGLSPEWTKRMVANFCKVSYHFVSLRLYYVSVYEDERYIWADSVVGGRKYYICCRFPGPLY